MAGREPNFHKKYVVFWAKHLQMGPTKDIWGPQWAAIKFENVYPPLFVSLRFLSGRKGVQSNPILHKVISKRGFGLRQKLPTRWPLYKLMHADCTYPCTPQLPQWTIDSAHHQYLLSIQPNTNMHAVLNPPIFKLQCQLRVCMLTPSL